LNNGNAKADNVLFKENIDFRGMRRANPTSSLENRIPAEAHDIVIVDGLQRVSKSADQDFCWCIISKPIPELDSEKSGFRISIREFKSPVAKA
jgi:hypothetical protein